MQASRKGTTYRCFQPWQTLFMPSCLMGFDCMLCTCNLRAQCPMCETKITF